MATGTEDREPTTADQIAEEVYRGGHYNTLAEQSGKLSPAEERFERGRRTVGLFAGPVLFVIVLAIPMGLTNSQQSLAAILALTIAWWVTEAIPIPVTAAMSVVLCVLFGVAEGDSVFGGFADSTLFLFIGSFIIAEAMIVHGLDRRFAFRVLSLPGVGNSSVRLVIAFAAAGALLSPFISNTAGAAMMLPIALGLIASVASMLAANGQAPKRIHDFAFATALLLAISYGNTVGGLLTPIGSPANLVGREFIQEGTGEEIGFFDWVVLAAPIVLVMFVIMCVILIVMNRPETKEIPGIQDYLAEERHKMGRMSRGERNTLFVFVAAVTFWVLPGAVQTISPDSALYEWLSTHADDGVVAILAAALLFMLPLNWGERRFTLSWNEATRIDWGTVLLFGAGLTLGSLLSETGLAEVIGEGLGGLLGVSSLIGITILVTIVAVITSETTSNTASAAIVVPIAISIAAAADVNPFIPGFAALFGANYGFMLPVSTPPNAIVYGSGMLPITRMVKTGAVFDLVGIVIIPFSVAIVATVLGYA